MSNNYLNIDTGQPDPKAILKKVKGIKNPSSLINRSKYSIRGAIIGLALGFMVSAHYRKSKMMGSVIGVIGGALCGDLYVKLTDKVKNKKQENGTLDKERNLPEK
jgi:hypothetical protein